eukprot:14918246-Ditylum_brightwellii.AAC.1
MALMMVEVLRRRLKKKGEKPDVPLDSSVDGSYNDGSSESDFSDPPIGYCGSESESESEYEYEDEEQHRSSNYASSTGITARKAREFKMKIALSASMA